MQTVVSADVKLLESPGVLHLAPVVDGTNGNSHAVSPPMTSCNFVTVPDGHSLVRTGAGQDLIGRSAVASVLQELHDAFHSRAWSVC